MVAEVFGGIAAFKAMFDITKGLKDVSDAAIRNSAIINLQNEILTAQQEQMALIERVRISESELAHLTTWEAEKQKYEMVGIAPKVVAYTQRNGPENANPRHYLCANCFAKGQKSFLQQAVRGAHIDRFKCNNCGEELTVQKDQPPRQTSSAQPLTGKREWI